MKRTTIIEIISNLNAHQVRYLIAGGLAVVFHGYMRFTSDIDLIIDLEEENVKKAINVFKKMGYQPRVPVDFSDLANNKIRQQWIDEKGMTVFSIFNTENVETPIDIFVEIPFDFKTEFDLAITDEIALGVKAFFISYDQLINMKKLSDREIDRIDIENLEKKNKHE
jgi:hypothetical protein